MARAVGHQWLSHLLTSPPFHRLNSFCNGWKGGRKREAKGWKENIGGKGKECDGKKIVESKN